MSNLARATAPPGAKQTGGVVAVLVACIWMPLAAKAATQLADVRQLADLSLEQLGQVVVTSVARRPQQLGSAAASIFVISREDIRRAGVTTLPEALRLAPNLQVARADATQYAITARGGNAVLANKLLVMIDGRTIYTPLFSGVFWEAQDVLLEDVDRIEVISGPGATLWGANAVNGVINIITQSSQATAGGLAAAYAGETEHGGALRYGTSVGDGGLRVYAKARHHDATHREGGVAHRDEADFGQAGFRSDFSLGSDGFTVQGDAYRGRIDMVPETRTIGGANLLARHTRNLVGGGSVTTQAYLDHTTRHHPTIFKERLDTFDLAFQHALAPLGSHALLWGGGYRVSRDRVTNTAALAFLPPDKTMHWANLFVQDEIRLSETLSATVGIKVESNPWTGGEFLPNLRLAWQPAPSRLLWGALSRAVRAPSRVDREYFIPGSAPYFLAGGPNFRSEIANVAELGYRAQVQQRLSWSITLFHHDFQRIRSVEPRPPGLQIENQIEGHTQGVEAWAEYRPVDSWRLVAGVVQQRNSFRRLPGSLDTLGIASVGNDPDSWWTLRSNFDLGRNVEFDLSIRRIGSLPLPPVPAYTAVDARVGWRPTPNWELSLILRNALDERHVEWGAAPNRSEFERAWLFKVVWQQ